MAFTQCIINMLFHDIVGNADSDEYTSIIVHVKDFDRLNKEIEERIDTGKMEGIDDFYDYLEELDDRGIYYREVRKFYLHDVVPGAD